MELYNKRSNIHVIGVLEEEKDGEAEEVLEEIMAEIFPHFAKDINIQSEPKR